MAFYVHVACAAVLLFVWQYLRSRHDPREPPLLPSKIPIIGHVIGVARHGFPYIAKSNGNHKFPIFALDFLVKKVYVVTSSKYVQAVQRESKVVSWDSVLGETAHRMAGIEGEGWARLKKPSPAGHGGNRSLNQDIVHSMQPTLMGTALDKMNLSMGMNLGAYMDKTVDQIKADKEGVIILDLFEWTRRAVYEASMEATWGPNHPLLDPKVEQAFIDFDLNLSTLVPNFFPKYTATIAYYGREKVIDEFVKYYDSSHHLQASSLAQARYNTQNDAGCNVRDIAALEVATVTAVLSNTVSTAFYILLDIFSRPDLRSSLREEIETHALVIDNTTHEHVIDLGKIREECPKLLSTFQEVLRTRSTASPTRYVKDDIVLGDTGVLLRKGSILFMPSQSVNREESVWGTSADMFDPMRFVAGPEKVRFVNGPEEKAGKDVKIRPSNFMSFGVAPALCPGRHFASGEILALVATVLMRFEVSPVDGSGVWKEPASVNTKAVATTIPPPAVPYMVSMMPRGESGEVKWSVRISEGKGKFGLVTG